jgi:hypothetical protein
MRKYFFTSFLLFFSFLVVGQEKPIQFGLENSNAYTFRFVNKQQDYSLTHSSVLMSLNAGHHSFFLGPEYSYLSKPFGDDSDQIKHSMVGGAFAYVYSHELKKWNSVDGFLRFNYSIFQLERTDYKELETRKSMVYENTLDLGLKKRFATNFYIYGSIGFGSTNGFFLMVDYAEFSARAGFGYTF